MLDKPNGQSGKDNPETLTTLFTQDVDKQNKKLKTIYYVGHHYMQASTNNVMSHPTNNLR